ncbi:hypothetical protein ABIB75_005943 [Bradyrhizobium sp. GM2.2]
MMHDTMSGLSGTMGFTFALVVIVLVLRAAALDGIPAWRIGA